MRPTQPKPVTKHPFRCTCPSKRMLGLYGRDESGRAYLHIVSHKGQAKLSQIYTTEPIDVWCKGCGQWWHVNIRNRIPDATPVETPTPVASDVPRNRQTLDNA